MASDYKILSACSDSGADLHIPITWDFDKIGDLSVIVVDDGGNASAIDYWTYDSSLKQVEIKNTGGHIRWEAYVARKEDAANLLQEIEGREINVQNILEQFRKTTRVIEELQEDSKTVPHSPDYIGGLLPNAEKRKGRFLSFDQNGNISCDIGDDEFRDAQSSAGKAMIAAQTAAEQAQAAAEQASEDAAALSNSVEAAADSADLAEQAAESAEQSKTAAQSAAQSAQTSKESASSAASAASASATAAQQAASSAETHKDNAQQAATAAGNSYAAAEQAAGNAANSATAAETAKSNAQTYAGNAQTSATQAADSAANAANLSAAAQNSAQAAADSAELAASLVVNATELGLAKSAEGSFEIFYADGAGGLMLARPLDRFPLSVCFCVKIQSQAVGDIYAGQDAIETASNAGFALYKDSASTSKLAIRLASNGALYSATFSDSALADGNLHSVCAILNGSGKVLIDGVEACETGAFPEGSDAIADAGAFYFGKSAGGRFELSKIRAFNFDMSAEGAAYSVAQCAAGKEPPPELLSASVFGDKNYNVYFRTNAQSRYDPETNNFYYYGPAGSSATLSTVGFDINFPYPFKVGQKVRVMYDSITGDAVLRNGAYGYMSFQNADNRYALDDTFFTGLGKTVLETVKTSNRNYDVPPNRIAVRAYLEANAADVQEIQINGFRIEIDGAVLNLADCVQASQAKDLSRSENHAVLLDGSVAGKSAVPAVMGGSHYWGADVSTGAYMLADSEVLPANSQVEILAKANAAATLNVGDSANSPTKYATAANVSTALASVATFYTGAVPTKLFITPSVAGLKLEYAIKVNEI